jgi:glycosyltransferase involved in cell wall biosynthesis
MKIVLAAGIFPPDIGGPATYTSQLAEALVQENYTVSVVCFSDSTQSMNEKYTVVRIKRSRLKLWSHLRYFFAIMKLGRSADCLYAQGPTAGGFNVWLACWLIKRPYVIKIIGDYAWEQGVSRYHINSTIEEFQTRTSLPLYVSLLNYLQRLVSRQATVVIVPSQYLARIVQGWGVAAENIRVIYNSFAVHFHTAVSQSEKGNIFLTGGRLVPWKGFDTLIKLWPRVLAQIPEARLHIAGDGPDYDQLERLIEHSQVADSVVLLGRLKPEQMTEQYGQARAFILNSDYEGMSHMILEAMAAGTIPLVSKRGGNQELIQDGVTGWSFSYNNSEEILAAILRVAQQPIDPHMIEAIQRRSREFSPEQMNETTIKMLTDVITTYRRG